MAFRVNAEKEFHDYHQLLDFLQEDLGQWNAYHSEQPYKLVIEKTKDEGTIDVTVEDTAPTTDRFGG